MEGGKEQNYWPGFVDALSNVVLTLVFVLVVFVFALALNANKVEKQLTEMVEQKKEEHAKERTAEVEKELQQVKQENIELKKQVEEMKKAADDDASSPKQQSTVKYAQATVQQASKDENGDLIVVFAGSAVSISEETLKTVGEFLAGFAPIGQLNKKITIEAGEDPSAVAISIEREARFGRILNVRNSLLFHKVPANNIQVRYVEPRQMQGTYHWVRIHVEK